MGEQIENQHHAAITQYGRPRQPRHRGELRPEVLHHDFP